MSKRIEYTQLKSEEPSKYLQWMMRLPRSKGLVYCQDAKSCFVLFKGVTNFTCFINNANTIFMAILRICVYGKVDKPFISGSLYCLLVYIFLRYTGVSAYATLYVMHQFWCCYLFLRFFMTCCLLVCIFIGLIYIQNLLFLFYVRFIQYSRYVSPWDLILKYT